MAWLAARLKRAGHLPSSFGYMVSRENVDEITDRFVTHVGTTLRGEGAGGAPVIAPEQYAIVGHSLGNIITRNAFNRLPAGFSRFVMLAPPNQSPLLARALKTNPLFRLLTGDPGQKLADPDWYERLPTPDVPTIILAGDGGPRFHWLPFSGATSDGIVALEETKLHDVPVRVVPALHTFIMNHPQVVRTISHFIETGVLADDEPGLTGKGAAQALSEM